MMDKKKRRIAGLKILKAQKSQTKLKNLPCHLLLSRCFNKILGEIAPSSRK